MFKIIRKDAQTNNLHNTNLKVSLESYAIKENFSYRINTLVSISLKEFKECVTKKYVETSSIDTDDVNMFYRFVFIESRSNKNFITVTAYDQLRYFKNTYTYCYENKTASELLQLIANEQRITTGTIENTVYKIAYNEEINQTLFDII